MQRLYAESLRDLFKNEQEGNDVKIEQAVMAYQKLVDARTNEFRLSDQVALIEALIDIYERRAPTKPLTKEDKECCERILSIISKAQNGASKNGRKGKNRAGT